MKWFVKRFDELTADWLYDILALRAEVFVTEQHCAYTDVDGNDRRAWHLFACRDGQLCCYLRILEPGVAFESYAFGRVVVAPAFRGRGYGHALLQQALDFATKELGATEIHLAAQAHLQRFYSAAGFTAYGEVYPEDGIPHINMVYVRKN